MSSLLASRKKIDVRPRQQLTPSPLDRKKYVFDPPNPCFLPSTLILHDSLHSLLVTRNFCSTNPKTSPPFPYPRTTLPVYLKTYLLVCYVEICLLRSHG